MIVLKPPARSYPIACHAPSIFLAGSIEMGSAEDWQTRVENELDDVLGVIFNPRRVAWDATLDQDPTPGTVFHEQVTWELDHIEKASLVLFYFDPATKSPISLFELGLTLASNKEVLVCCPDGFYRKGNVVITCERYSVNVLDSLDQLIEETKRYLHVK